MLKSLLGSTTARLTAVLFAAVIATGGIAAAVAATSGPSVVTHSDGSVSGTDTPTGTVTGTSEEEDHEAVTATDHEGDDTTATVTATANENDNAQGDEVTGTVTGTASDVNHGHCVSFAAHNAAKAGLSGNQVGIFVSTVARDKLAVSAEVGDNAMPDASCLTAMLTAKAAALAGGGSVSGTATPSHGEQDGGHGKSGSVSSGSTTRGAGDGSD